MLELTSYLLPSSYSTTLLCSVSEQILHERLELCEVEGELDVGGGQLSVAQQLLNNPEHVAAVERTAANWLHVIGKSLISLPLIFFDTQRTVLVIKICPSF